jgi:hypothetical protein
MNVFGVHSNAHLIFSCLWQSYHTTDTKRMMLHSKFVDVKEADRELVNRYCASLKRANGIVWQNAFNEPLSILRHPYPMKTILQLPPGYAERPYPAIKDLSLAPTTQCQHRIIASSLERAFQFAVTQDNLPMAFRYAFIKIIQLRYILIQCAPGGTMSNHSIKTTTDASFYVLQERDVFPAVPIELSRALHSVSYGANRMETVCRQALGIDHLVGSFAGVSASMPIFTVNRLRHTKSRSKHFVDVVCLLFKVRRTLFLSTHLSLSRMGLTFRRSDRPGSRT